MCWLLVVKLPCFMIQKDACACLQLLDWRVSVTLGELRGHSDNIRQVGLACSSRDWTALQLPSIRQCCRCDQDPWLGPGVNPCHLSRAALKEQVAGSWALLLLQGGAAQPGRAPGTDSLLRLDCQAVGPGTAALRPDCSRPHRQRVGPGCQSRLQRCLQRWAGQVFVQVPPPLVSIDKKLCPHPALGDCGYVARQVLVQGVQAGLTAARDTC